MNKKHVLIVYDGPHATNVERVIVFDDADRAWQAFINHEFGTHCALAVAQHNIETKLPESEQMELFGEATHDSFR